MVSANRVSSGDGEPDPIASGAIPRDFGSAAAFFLRRRGFPSDLFADLVAFGTVRLAEWSAQRERNLAGRQAEGSESWRSIHFGRSRLSSCNAAFASFTRPCSSGSALSQSLRN